MKQHPAKLQIGYLFPESDAFGIYYRKSDSDLGAQFKSAIRQLKKSGTLNRLATKYSIPAVDVK
jgi:ABC-type amino acid transport substrate-binding protein